MAAFACDSAGAVRGGRLALLAAAWALAGGACGAAEPGGIASEPLAAHAYPRGPTLFTLLPPEQTGVRTENPYDDPLMKGRLYEEFETSSIGTGVAIGDYDGDGRPDLFVVSKTGSCRLFRNLGGWKFEDVTGKAGVGNAQAPGVWNQGATFVDINNDGRLDLYVCRRGAPNLLYINQGDGTFKERAHAYGLDVNDSSVMASFCDYDRDGRLDVYIATNILDISNHPNGQRGRLLHQNPDGTFTEVTGQAGIAGESQSHSAAWWDYDGDGWPDLYVANDYGKADHLYHNNRDGTFTDALDAVLPHTSFASMGSDLGDVNNDGRVDFLVVDMAARNHADDQHSPADARALTEVPDNSSQAPKYHRNALLLATGVGRLWEAANLAGVAATDWTWSARLEDLDNDGRLDLYVTNGMVREAHNVDLLLRQSLAQTPS
ncbi:MAG TPA: VCBS repeat-containing protein, partial [Opitutaceae bacterium]|nr:VCBS repeat-containing protein [Opitutaceae bacterium]